MPIQTREENLESLRKQYNAKDNIELFQKMEQAHPGLIAKTIQETFNPTILYQYTTLDALTMILSTGKLKLNSLKNVDDKIEGLSDDIGNLKKYFFASCWTTESEESIPMWNMYGKGMAGIRIGLPENPFPIHMVDYDSEHIKFSKTDYIYFPDEYVVNDEFLLRPTSQILTAITYTDDENLLKPKVIKTQTSNSLQLELGKIGKYKNRYWEFQKEVRYLTNIYPGAGIKTLNRLPDDIGSSILANSLLNNIDVSIDSIYLDIEPDRLKTIEILLGPKISQADKILVNLLCEKYAPNAKIQESKLTGKV